VVCPLRFSYSLLWSLGGWARDARYDNLEKIGRLKSPLLVFHRDRDSIVPQRMGKALFDRPP
jgi:fermentation-respiration switch protein FrsA (DUF1100 family)